MLIVGSTAVLPSGHLVHDHADKVDLVDPGLLQVCRVQAQMVAVSAVNATLGVLIAYGFIVSTASVITTASGATPSTTQTTSLPLEQAGTVQATHQQPNALKALAAAVPIALPAIVSACIRPETMASQATASLLAAAAAGGSLLAATAVQAPAYTTAAAVAYGKPSPVTQGKQACLSLCAVH